MQAKIGQADFVIWINAKEVRINHLDHPEESLLQFLRRKCGLKGTKLGCGEGGCGACTVVIGDFNQQENSVSYYSVNACLMPVAACHQKHVITVEGIGTMNKPHLIQEAMAKDASQCGFCTPGFVMSLYAAWRNGILKKYNIEELLDGNLCRCTGYRPIIDAARTICDRSACSLGANCCKNKKTTNSVQEVDNEKKEIITDGLLVDCTQEIIFPPKLKIELENSPKRYACFVGSNVTWHQPILWEEVLQLFHQYPDAKIVFGNTEVGIEAKNMKSFASTIIYIGNVTELRYITNSEKQKDKYLEIGAGVTLTELKQFCEKERNNINLRNLGAVYEMLQWFAGHQIRNVSSWSGNLVNASPISDLNPIWVALNAQLLISKYNTPDRTIKVEDFFLDYKKVALLKGEVVKAIKIPFTAPNEHVRAYKQSKRKEDDITIVNVAYRIKLSNGNIIEECAICYGGMGPTIKSSKEAVKLLIGIHLQDEESIEVFLHALSEEYKLPLDAVGGMAVYRQSLAPSLFVKFLLEIAHELGLSTEQLPPSTFATPLQSCQTAPPTSSQSLVGQSIPHLSALKHSTGNAEYVDDIPALAGELYAGLVLSTKSHAKIISIDFSVALQVENVIDCVTYKDVKGINSLGPVFNDETVFVEDKVTACGQIIAIILATDQPSAQKAAKLVKIGWEELPSILTIEEAIKANSFHPPIRSLQKGNSPKEMEKESSSSSVVRGQVYIGGQEHFYLETQAAIVIPKKEDCSIEIISSTQNPTEGQHMVAKVLGLPFHKVICRVKRIGGGFGGKETRSSMLTAALAVAARKADKPVRCMMDRDEDMIFSGQRHPFFATYTISMSEEGLLRGADVKLYSNGGHSMDLSLGVLERALSHLDNCYNFPALRVTGRICKTNLPSNTAFRGFGGPQGMFVCETMISHISQHLKLNVDEVRRRNLYREGDLNHIDMVMENVPLEQMWEFLNEKSEYDGRRRDVDDFNKRSRWIKRGISMIPTKFGIAFGVKHLNQAGALVHVYADGSILLTHGGVEMGQGLHTKMCQVAANALGVPLETVHLEETNTSTVPNTSPSAASASSDLNGMAVLDACNQINERLAPLKAAMPTASFSDICRTAYLQRIDLSAHGFYATPHLGFDWAEGKGRLFNYYTFGVCCSEVELDLLTGSHTVLRSDIVMDVGRSLNPTVDLGQIEGAFTQGLGLFTIEQALYLRNGMLLNRGPGGYKIPTAANVPRQFNVHLMPHCRNELAIHGSKAVGEPPLFLASSVLFALSESVKAARKDMNGDRDGTMVILNSPATAERLRLAIGDEFLGKPSDDEKGIYLMRDPQDNPHSWCIEV